MSANVAIALGSNLGESQTILADAITTLSQTNEITVTTYSSWYQTKPIGPPQPDYINACALLKVELGPHQLLKTLLDIEQEFGRKRIQHWGPRTLDLDLILYEDLILDTPDLIIPHPRMKERAFVLMPLAEIAPNWIEPITNQTISFLLEKVDCTGIKKISPENL